jgi:hypothetical protein
MRIKIVMVREGVPSTTLLDKKRVFALEKLVDGTPSRTMTGFFGSNAIAPP